MGYAKSSSVCYLEITIHRHRPLHLDTNQMDFAKAQDNVVYRFALIDKFQRYNGAIW